jgi:hypothetical protein
LRRTRRDAPRGTHQEGRTITAPQCERSPPNRSLASTAQVWTLFGVSIPVVRKIVPYRPSLRLFSGVHRLESATFLQRTIHPPFAFCKVPPEACDKQGQTTVAAFRPWRGLPALNPHPLTAPSICGVFEGNSTVRANFFIRHPACMQSVRGAYIPDCSVRRRKALKCSLRESVSLIQLFGLWPRFIPVL